MGEVAESAEVVLKEHMSAPYPLLTVATFTVVAGLASVWAICPEQYVAWSQGLIDKMLDKMTRCHPRRSQPPRRALKESKIFIRLRCPPEIRSFCAPLGSSFGQCCCCRWPTFFRSSVLLS